MLPTTGVGGSGLFSGPGPSSLSLALVVVLLMGGLGFTWLSSESAVTVVLDGEPLSVRTHAATVGELLERSGLEVAPDQVTPSLDTPVADGLRVVVDRDADLAHMIAHAPAELPGRPAGVRPSRSTRMELVDVGDRAADDLHPVSRIETRTEVVAHATVERPTDALPEGESREVQVGSDGVREVVVEIIEVDGVETAREVVATRLVTAPVDRVVEVGTGRPAPDPDPADEPTPPPPPPPPAPEPEPEPQQPAAEPEPEPVPEEDPAPANRQEGGASWYDNPYGGLTAAHRTLPRGTIVTVTNLANGKQVQVRINDSGPYVKGRIIDLNREAFAHLAPPSRGVIQVRIEW